jgi:probable rRNA maturation factor
MEVSVTGTRDGRLITDIRALVRRLNRDFSTPDLAVTVIFADDRHIRDLNLRYRRRDRPTDVLSFNLQSAPLPSSALRPSSSPLGEVYVSRTTARRQARECRVTLASELRRLALHGLLHLLGLTHRQMEPLYDRYLGRPRT